MKPTEKWTDTMIYTHRHTHTQTDRVWMINQNHLRRGGMCPVLNVNLSTIICNIKNNVQLPKF